MSPEVTIITVVKDDIAGLKMTAASILCQKYRNFEWLIVDGYSSDGSWQYALDLQSLEFVTSIQSPPTGIYGAMNVGARESNTPWIWFVNAGDKLLTEDSLEKIVNVAGMNNSASVVASPVVYMTPTNHFFSLSLPKVVEGEMSDYAIFHHQGCLINRVIYSQINGFDESLTLAADGKLLDMMIKIARPVIAPIVAVGFEMGGATSQNFWRSLKEIQLYRPHSFTNRDMVVYQLKEIFRAAFLVCLGTTIGRYVLNSYVRRREKAVISDANLNGLDIPKGSKFDVS